MRRSVASHDTGFRASGLRALFWRMPENTSRLSAALADRYRIDRRLGEGGMATVYLAEDLKHDRRVAPKVLEMGTFFTLQTGTPLNEFAPGPGGFGPSIPAFLVPRGSVGRTPAIWDLNFRLAYTPPFPFRCRTVLDVLHAGNPREVILMDQVHYMGLDDAGAPSDVNPAYLGPLAYQPPMMLRLGIEVQP